MVFAIYLEQLATMKKKSVRISALLASLRPVMSQYQKRLVLDSFQTLGAVNGEIQLGSWLGQMRDAELRHMVVTAFGCQDESQAAGMSVEEAVFVELLADLAPFVDLNALLA